MVELAKQIDIQPLVCAPKLNTRKEKRAEGLRYAIDELQQAVAKTTASGSPAVKERASAWLGCTAVETLPYGGEWTLKPLASRANKAWSGNALGDAAWGILRMLGTDSEFGDAKWFGGSAAYPSETEALENNVLLFYPQGYESPFPSIGSMQIGGAPSLRTEISAVNLSPLENYSRAREAVRNARDEALDDIRRRLDSATATYASVSPRRAVEYLTEDVGMGQLVVARAIGVSPTAIRKWRRGETAKPEHRSRLARLAALTQLLVERGPYDPAGWLDIPISTESSLSPIDLFIESRSDLVVLHGWKQADPHETLDAFDEQWREKYATDTDYEIVTLGDGSRSVVPRKPGS